MRADLDRHAAGDLGHRLQQRQTTARPGHGLIGDARRARRHQPLGLRLVGGEVEIGEEQVARLEQRDFARLRLLDLHDHFALREHVGRRRDDARADVDIVLVVEIDSRSRLGLDDDLMAGGDQLGDRRRGQPDAIFVVLDFLGYADAHGRSPDFSMGAAIAAKSAGEPRKMRTPPCRAIAVAGAVAEC